MNDVKKYFDKYDNLEKVIYNNKINDEEQILIELKNDLNEISQCKELVNKSKSLMIKINKSKNLLKIKHK
jgi:protein subunit release factor A